MERAGEEGAVPLSNLRELGTEVPSPRVIWLMLPAGAPTEDTLREITPFLEEGDVVLDGGNSHYRDSIRRAYELAQRGIPLLDVGTSGGEGGPGDGSSATREPTRVPPGPAKGSDPAYHPDTKIPKFQFCTVPFLILRGVGCVTLHH